MKVAYAVSIGGQLGLRRCEGHTGCEHARRPTGLDRNAAPCPGCRLATAATPRARRELETITHHANHGRVLLPELHGATEHSWIAAEARAPEVVPDDSRWWCTRTLVPIGEHTAHERRTFSNAKTDGGHLRDLHGARVTASDDQFRLTSRQAPSSVTD